MNNKTIMEKVSKAALALLCLIAVSTPCPLTPIPCLYAAFSDSDWGARPVGMGYAYTAIADDSNGQLFNPAGAARARGQEINFSYAKLYTGLEGVDIGQSYAGFIAPMSSKAGVIGLTWSALFTPNLYREDTVALTYGRNISRLLDIRGINILAGTNIKYFKNEFTLDERTRNDPVFEKRSYAEAVGVDAGVIICTRNNRFSMGVMGKNVNQPDIGIKTSDRIPSETVVGIAYSRASKSAIKCKDLTISADLVKRNKVLEPRFGAEKYFFERRFAVRCGYNTYAITSGLGIEINLWSGTRIALDYAFAMPLTIEKTTGSHRMSIVLRFP